MTDEVEKTDLDEFLNGDETPTPEPAPEPEADEKPAEASKDDDAEGADDKPEETPKGDEDKDDTTPVSREEFEGVKKALLEERRKRQELEKTPEPAPEPEPLPDPVEDPDGFAAAVEARAEAKANAKFQQAEADRVNQSEQRARAAHPDFDEVAKNFFEAAQLNPALADEVRQASDPAEKAYEIGKRIAQMNEIGDPEAYKAKLKAEALAELEAEKAEKQKTDEDEALKDQLPEDLTGVASDASLRSKSGAGAKDESLDDILK